MMGEDAKKDLKTISKELFDLRIDKASNQEIIDDIKKDSVFKGPSLWILFFAIIIVSIGLDINSTAVIIGGMLISPLMGPIMGIGMGLYRNDLDLLKTAGFNIFTAIVLSVLASALYFYISPLNKIQSELLSRTSPAVWDVLIAFSGGLAGIIAYTRKEKNNVIPGVAIATALMPPLSTAGFGLATGNYNFFFGALYLFAINSVFIAFGTYLVIRILKIRKKKYLDEKIEQRSKRIIAFLIILIIIPSVLTAIKMVKKNTFERNAEMFISNEFNFDNTLIISKNFRFNKNPKEIDITLYGEKIDTSTLSKIKSKLSNYNLNNTDLVIIQGDLGNKLTEEMVQELRDNLKEDILRDMNNKSFEKDNNKDELIKSLEEKLKASNNNYYPLKRIGEEAKVNFPKITSITISKSPILNLKKNIMDTIPVVIAKFEDKQTGMEIKRFNEWLKVRLQVDTIDLMIRK